jgi:predicted dehydrogenase
MIKVGVVGVGSMGKNHVRIYSNMKNIELAGIVDINKALAKKVALQHNIIYYTNFRELLGKVDAVSIAVPTKFHYTVAKAFLQNGIDVLLEKPMTISLKEAKEVTKIAEKNQRVLLVGHVERFNPAVEELKKIMENPLFIETRRMGPYSEKMREGVILDLMTHDIDILLYLIKEKIVSMNCYIANTKSKFEDIAVAQILFKNGMLAILTASRMGQTKIRKLNITQSDCYMTLDYMSQNINIFRKSTASYLPGKEMRYRQESVKEIPYIERKEPLLAELEHFIDCVSERKKPKVGGEDAQSVLEVALKLKKIGWTR